MERSVRGKGEAKKSPETGQEEVRERPGRGEKESMERYGRGRGKARERPGRCKGEARERPKIGQGKDSYRDQERLDRVKKVVIQRPQKAWETWCGQGEVGVDLGTS